MILSGGDIATPVSVRTQSLSMTTISITTAQSPSTEEDHGDAVESFGNNQQEDIEFRFHELGILSVIHITGNCV